MGDLSSWLGIDLFDLECECIVKLDFRSSGFTLI